MGKELVRGKMMEILRMMQAHVSAVAELERVCFRDPWSEKSVASELDNPIALWLVACVDGDVVGYVGSQSVIDQADMMNVAVNPEYRRQGIAEALILRLIEELKASGILSLSLEVRASNSPAIALYEKLGFKSVGRRPNYYRNPKEDALILRKEWEL